MSSVLEQAQLEPASQAERDLVETQEHPPRPQTTPATRPTRPSAPEERALSQEEILRPALGALMTTLGCAFLVGGMFVGYSPRVYAGLGGLAGVAMAVWAARARKRPGLVQTLSLIGVIIAGLILLAISDLGSLSRLGDVISTAAKNARLHKPPSPFETGWRAILPWTLGLIGYAAAWVGSVGRKPALGLMVPLPVIAFSAIAQPSEAQVPAGIVAFATFLLGLAIIYRADRGEGEGVSTAYELKRAMRTAPLAIVLVGALIAASQLNLLFPAPLYDPTERAQLPHAVPLKAVKDRVLFTVLSQSGFTGPWRVGVLDVYDGANWRLPPYAASSFKPAPRSGLLGEAFGQPAPGEQQARVTLSGLEGVVLPLPARMNGLVVDRGPPLVTDARTQTVRVDQGQVSTGLAYTAVFAFLPKEDALRRTGPPVDTGTLHVADMLDTANQKPPAAVQSLLARAPANGWDRLNFLRRALLDTVTSTGAGLPVAVPPSKVQDMLAGSKKATPFEIVAAQALMARWAGVPARIGYGFDHGEKTGNSFEYHPKHGSAWLEVYFQGFGWFPVTGLPKHAQASLGSGETTVQADILPSNDIAVQLFIPLRVPQSNLLFKQIQLIVLFLLLPIAAAIALVWLLWPVAYKARRRSVRRQWALQQGRAARIAVAYTEMRDLATDLGVGDPYVTPLAYVNKVVPDDEHLELAWLVTRTLWGDLQAQITDDEVFAAEELSRSLRRRLFEAQPFTIRGIAVISRLSLRDPYAPELLSPPLKKWDWRSALKPSRWLPGRARRKEKVHEALETV